MKATASGTHLPGPRPQPVLGGGTGGSASAVAERRDVLGASQPILRPRVEELAVVTYGERRGLRSLENMYRAASSLVFPSVPGPVVDFLAPTIFLCSRLRKPAYFLRQLVPMLFSFSVLTWMVERVSAAASHPE